MIFIIKPQADPKALANYYIFENLNGFGNWFNIQAQKERDYALLFIKYLQIFTYLTHFTLTCILNMYIKPQTVTFSIPF